MKTNLFLVIFFLFLNTYLQSSAQERVNAATERFDKKSEAITYATYWEYNPTSQKWTSRKNNTMDRSPNFISVQTGIERVDTSDYYFLIINYWAGDWDYPSVQVGWTEYKSVQIYVYAKKEFSKLKNITSDTTIILPHIYESRYHGKYNQYSEHKFLLLFKKFIIKNRPDWMINKDDFFTVKKTKSNAKDVIRFLFPMHGPATNKCFGTEYFEIQPISFNKLISTLQ